MTQKHTPEPWEFSQVEMKIKGSQSNVIADVSSKMNYSKGNSTQYANAERIVKCVNLLAGRTDAHLAEMERWLKRETSAYMFDVITKNEKLREENERLKNALQKVLDQNMLSIAGEDIVEEALKIK